jgi:hypothetical protein
VRRFLPAIVLACTAACDLLIPPIRDAMIPGYGAGPLDGPERDCAQSCASVAARCSARQCASGCSVAIDRLAQGEGPSVVACVAQEPRCDDRAWAHCAVRVGPYADGGPPPPPPPPGPDEEP